MISTAFAVFLRNQNLLPKNIHYAFSHQKIKFSFKRRDGSITPVQAEEGKHLLEIAKHNDVELEGACEASLACSTCHVILPQNLYNKV